MPRTRSVVAVLAILGTGIVVWAVVAIVGKVRTDADAMRVYCLAPERHESLVNAATALDLGKRGIAKGHISVDDAELTADDWHDRYPDEFEQACAALSATRQPGSTGVFATVLPFLTALIGAGSAFAATAWRDRLVRGQNLADDLRVAAGNFLRACEDFLTEWRPGAPDTELVVQRLTLTTQVSRTKAAYPDWALAKQLETLLTTGLLGTSLTKGWRTGYDGEAVNDARRAELRVLLEKTRADLFTLAERVQRPLRAGGAR